MSCTDPSPLLRIGVPKGSLQDSTISLFDQAGYQITIGGRSYFPSIDDPELEAVLFRSQEMSRYVEDGILDAGITGHDWVVENGSDVHEVCELTYSKATSRPVRWVLAVSEESPVTRPQDLAGAIIATELVNMTQGYFEKLGVPIKKIEFSWGATEVKARLVDAIVDSTETGSSLRANNLRIVDTILTSTTRLIANQQSWSDPAKRRKIESLAVLLKGAIEARQKAGLKMNVPRGCLDAVISLLPAEKSPTISQQADEQWVAVEVIVSEKSARDLIPQLSRAGATGIISYGLNLVVH